MNLIDLPAVGHLVQGEPQSLPRIHTNCKREFSLQFCEMRNFAVLATIYHVVYVREILQRENDGDIQKET